MKSKIITLESGISVRWNSWDHLQPVLDEKREQGTYAFMSPDCLVFDPSDFELKVMHFNYVENVWRCDDKKFEIYEISHWAFLPDLPKQWKGEAMDEIDTWFLTEEHRKQQAKEVSKKLFRN